LSFSNELTIGVDARDDTAIDVVTFHLPDQTLEIDDTYPYEVQWDTGSVENGTYPIRVEAVDGTGKIAVDTIWVFIRNSQNHPLIYLNMKVQLQS